MGPGLVLAGRRTLQLHLLLGVVEAHYFLADAGSTAVLRLVGEVKNLQSRRASAIVLDALSKATDQSAFATVHVAYHCYTHIIFLPD